MYDKTGEVIIDRREMLKVKLLSLVAEVAIIRRYEKKLKGALHDEMRAHRRVDIRNETRLTHLAYGIIRGRPYEKMEGWYKVPPDWTRIKKMVEKYGPRGLGDTVMNTIKPQTEARIAEINKLREEEAKLKKAA